MPALPFSDNFNRTDGAVGANYVGSGFGSGAEIVGNRIEPAVSDGTVYTSLIDATFDDDQYILADIGMVSGSTQAVGIMVRMDGSGNGYMFMLRTQSGGQFDLFRMAGGNIAGFLGESYPGVGDYSVILKMEGTTLSVAYQSTPETPILSGTDSTHTGGKTGVYIYDFGASSAPYIDNIETGNIAVATVPAAVDDLAGTAGNTQVPLTWTAPDDGGSAITDYVVRYRPAIGGS